MIYHFRLKNSVLVEFNSEHCKIIIEKSPGTTEEVALARADSRILELLLMSPGTTCSREAIQEFAWDDRVVSTGSLNQSIFMLRNILGDSKDHEILITVPRRGYRFNSDYLINEPGASAAPEQEDLEQGPPNTEPALPAPSGTPGIGRVLQLGYLAAAVLAVLAVWRIYAWYQPVNELQVVVIKQGELSISAVGKNKHEVDKLSAEIAGLNLSTPEMKGQVFISRTGPRFNISCIRTTGLTYNAEFQLHDESLARMLKKCVAAE